MTFPLRIHYDNLEGFAQPQLHLWTRTGVAQDFASTGHDAYGAVYDVRVAARECGFVFRDEATRSIRPRSG